MIESTRTRINENVEDPLKQALDPSNAFVLLGLKEEQAAIKQSSGNAKLRVTLLTDDQKLLPRLQRSLGRLQADITCIETVNQANKLINSGQSDITIVDVQGADRWPGAAFQLFDERAARDLVVILCRDNGDIRNYRERSLHAFDIFPIDAIDDHRFQCVIQAALLRAEVVSSEKHGDDIDPRSLRSLTCSLPVACD